MLQNYFLIAARYILRHKVFTFINVAGLSIGITCSLLILIYVQNELSYDRFHQSAGQIYRLGTTGSIEKKKILSAKTGAPVAHELPRDIKEIESAVRLVSWATFPVRYEDRSFTEPHLLLADPDFFNFFSFDLVQGHPDSVLVGPRQIVITESAALKYFDYNGEEDQSPIGKTMVLAQGYTAQVSGIAKDPPSNSHFHFSLILSLRAFEEVESEGWIKGNVYSYMKLGNNTNPTDVLTRANAILDTRLAELKSKHATDTTASDQQDAKLNFFLQPLLDIHLHSNLNDEIEANGNITYIYLFTAIAVFITLLACINFINLSTAQSVNRAKEVAVRKMVGAQNIRLVRQFLMESYIYIVISICISFFIVLVLVSPLSYFTGEHLTIKTLFQPGYILFIVVFIIGLGLLAGSYPAFYLTNLTPVAVLKGKLRSRLRNYGIRNVLVVFQFFISSALIISSLVLYTQINYLQRINLGFDKSNVVNLLHTKNLGDNGDVFKKQLLSNPNILAASYSNRLPPHLDWEYIFHLPGAEKDYLLNVYEMDYDHLSTMGYTLMEGRFFSSKIPTDSNALILNETAAALLKQNQSGLKLMSYYDSHEGRLREVIGIIKNFNALSLKDPIQPMAVVLGPSPNWEMAIRLKPEATHETLEFIEATFKKYAPHAPFEYAMLDQNFEAKQKTEKQIGILFMIFTTLAIIIASLGLYGLSTYTAQQRIKEIGVRKTLGASGGEITALLSYNFLKLISIGYLIAIPVSYFGMQRWLDNFAFHITPNWKIFVVAGVGTVFIAMVSICVQVIKSGQINPVDALRTE